MGAFARDRLPGWEAYAEQAGLTLQGKGRWRTTLCDFHPDTSPSMRVNLESGGWVCMSCRTHGGDVLSHHMQRFGTDFVSAARALGAWDDGAPWSGRPMKAQRLSARDALTVVAFELHDIVVVLSAARRGLLPSDADWERFLDACGRVVWLAGEYAE